MDVKELQERKDLISESLDIYAGRLLNSDTVGLSGPLEDIIKSPLGKIDDAKERIGMMHNLILVRRDLPQFLRDNDMTKLLCESLPRYIEDLEGERRMVDQQRGKKAGLNYLDMKISLAKKIFDECEHFQKSSRQNRVS